MKKDHKQTTNNSNMISTSHIAPCGMNCRLCLGYLREKNTCPGCLCITPTDSKNSKHRSTCTIRNCQQLAHSGSKYCSKKCERFPCARLKQLDKRYRTKYGMSMLENLIAIDESGIRNFVRSEKKKWNCPDCGQLLCVHKPTCLSCGYEWQQQSSA